MPSNLLAMVLDGNDREVIEGCQHGDPDAFRALYAIIRYTVLP